MSSLNSQILAGYSYGDEGQKIFQLKKELTRDGWFVNELTVAPGDSDFNDGAVVLNVKSEINDIYNASSDDDKPKVLFILGQIPLPRSGKGLQAPDGNHCIKC